MKENFIKTKPFKTLVISQGLTGKMAGMPAITTSLLCNENCKGLCPVCGCNLNVEECSCEVEDIDPRLAVLKDFLK